MATDAEKWLAAVNAKLSEPVVAGSREDEIAFDAFIAGKKPSEAAAAVQSFRDKRAA